MIVNLNYLGQGGGGGVTPSEVEEIVDEKIVSKQDKLTAGEGIYITDDNVISTKPYTTTADTYVAWCDADGNWTVDYNIQTATTYSPPTQTMVKGVVGKGVTRYYIINTPNLKSLEFEDPSNITSFTIGYNCYIHTINSDIEEVADFSNFTKLNSVNFNNNKNNNGFRGQKIILPDNGVFTSLFLSNTPYLKEIVIPDSVTSINKEAFYRCNSLTSVTIPSSVTTIGEGAFNYVPTGGTLYCDEDWFNNLDATSKGYLYNVANWTRKPLPKPLEERVTDLEENKQDVLVSGENIKTINGEDILGEGDIVIESGGAIVPSANTYVALCDIFGNWSIEYFDDGVVPQQAFDNKKVLKAIFGEGITKLGAILFGQNNIYIEEIVVRGTISLWNTLSIGGQIHYPFASLSNLKSVTFIGSQTIPRIFSGNFNFKPSNLTVTFISSYQSKINIDGIAHNGEQFYFKTKYGGDINRYSQTIVNGIVYNAVSPTAVIGSSKDITNASIGSGVTSIGDSAFSGCTSLTSVTIGDKVTSIGDSAFRSCSGLTSVDIPNSVTSIGNYAFESCSGLTSVIISNSVTSIGSSTFSSCINLTSVVIPNSVTSIGSSAFYKVPTGGTLYCDEDWFNNLDATSKGYLYNVANWERKPLSEYVPLSELESNTVTLTATLEDGTTKTFTLLGKEV